MFKQMRLSNVWWLLALLVVCLQVKVVFVSLALSKDDASSSSGWERYLVHHGECEHLP